MSYKWIGAILVILGCGGTGFSIAAACRREEKMLNQLLRILQNMESELQYRLTPLPELCRQAGKEADGALRSVFLGMARELDWQICPDACSCMRASLAKSKDMPANLRKLLLQLGHTLGRFDLPGQVRSLQGLQSTCEKELKRMERSRDSRLRSYQTLWLCGGAALVILFA